MRSSLPGTIVPPPSSPPPVVSDDDEGRLGGRRLRRHRQHARCRRALARTLRVGRLATSRRGLGTGRARIPADGRGTERDARRRPCHPPRPRDRALRGRPYVRAIRDVGARTRRRGRARLRRVRVLHRTAARRGGGATDPGRHERPVVGPARPAGRSALPRTSRRVCRLRHVQDERGARSTIARRGGLRRGRLEPCNRYGALYADVTFAKLALVEHCERDGVAFEPWTDFDDVRRWLEGDSPLPGPVSPPACPGWTIV